MGNNTTKEESESFSIVPLSLDNTGKCVSKLLQEFKNNDPQFSCVQLSESTLNAFIVHYTTEKWYQQLNTALKERKYDSEEYRLAVVLAFVNNRIYELDLPDVVFSGKTFTNGDIQLLEECKKSNKKAYFKAFFSTTAIRDNTFPGNTLVVIKLPQGQRTCASRIKKWSVFKSEDEVLLSFTCGFIVLDVQKKVFTKKGGNEYKFTISLELVDNTTACLTPKHFACANCANSIATITYSDSKTNYSQLCNAFGCDSCI